MHPDAVLALAAARAPGIHDMRHIGTITEPKQAERFVLFLASQHIEAALRPLQETGYAVWVLDEERVATARQQLETFLAMPDDPQFDVPEEPQPRVARRFLQHRPPADRSQYMGYVRDARDNSQQRRACFLSG